MSKPPNQEQITLLGKVYTIVCTPEERHDLLDAAALLNTKMSEIREADRVMNNEKVAIMAALNLSHDVLKEQRKVKLSSDISSRLSQINERLTNELGQFND